jgi:chloramphenicol O-acetyltransferase type A
MQNFERRRDRFELFDRMDSPALNLTFTLDLPDLRPWCKAQNLPPFHVLLCAVLRSILKVENFRYRVFDGTVIRIDRLAPSYTVVNQHNDLNFAQFDWSDDLREFVARSLVARDEASSMTALNEDYRTLSPREFKDRVFVTCIPWLDFTSIQHPTATLATPDIPSLAWGKFRDAPAGRVQLPFSVQAHHGFVDGYHINELAQQISSELSELMR